MADAVLVLNAGSSSLKFAVFLDGSPPRPLLRGTIEDLLTSPRFTPRDASTLIAGTQWPAGKALGHQGAIEFLLGWGRTGVLAGHRIVAVGHRVVHGGTRFGSPALLEADTIAELEGLVPLAPLHQPHNLAAIKAVARVAPALPQIACFDQGVHRYGFHGLSYEYVVSVLGAIDRRAAAGRTVVAHLGNGASMCALSGGRSVAATGGFSTLDGLVMGTRCGAIDPGALLHLLDQYGMGARAVQQLVYEQSDLLGVSGLASDMRDLLASSDIAAAEAVELFVYRIARELGSLAVALGGIDALVFTGGIGESAAVIRALVCWGVSWLGVELDEEANITGGPCVSAATSGVTAWVIPTDEEAMIALHTRRALGSITAAAPRRSGTHEH